ncbi:MAG: TIGR03862 family flavoprotein [Flavobacteriales bacterium]|nr:TIGR03862 family flavoprotein [Flavobacteriales bacterium]
MNSVAIIGGGPAGLIAADRLAATHEVHVYEQGRTLGRKFLVAGEGGLNITNSAAGEELIAHYSPPDRMREILEAFGPAELRAWLEGLGVPTYVGSSGRVFPERGIKPAEVLKAIMERVNDNGVFVHTDHRFVGFDDEVRPLVEHAGTRAVIEAKIVVFALGGASWPKTGSTGTWTKHFESIGVRTVPFRASNCGVEVDLSDAIRVHAGKPLKNVAVSCGERSVRGEVTITEYGLEGNAIYPLVPAIREALEAGAAEITLDLKPDLTAEQIDDKLKDAAWKERMSALRLDRPSVTLLKTFTPFERYVDGRTMAEDVKRVQIPVTGLRPIAEAISTVGGIALDQVSPNLSLIMHPHLFVAGEMLDWDAPTGGFLLQGAFSTGHWAAAAIGKR